MFLASCFSLSSIVVPDKIRSFNIFIGMYFFKCIACLDACVMYVQVSPKARKGRRTPGAGVIVSGGLPDLGAGDLTQAFYKSSLYSNH